MAPILKTAVVDRVWITDSCIICNACESTAPEVFNCDGDQAHIRADARSDGLTDMNPDHAPLTAAARELSEAIIEAAAGCPVEAIALKMA
jgi:ferredoxin